MMNFYLQHFLFSSVVAKVLRKFRKSAKHILGSYFKATKCAGADDKKMECIFFNLMIILIRVSAFIKDIGPKEKKFLCINNP